MVVSFTTVAPAIAERYGIKFSKPFSFLVADDTLRWRDFVSNSVIAVRICHVPQPEVSHFGYLYLGDTRGLIAGIGTQVIW